MDTIILLLLALLSIIVPPSATWRVCTILSASCREGVRLLKKSLSEQLVIQNRTKTSPNADKTRFSAPEIGVRKGSSRSFSISWNVFGTVPKAVSCSRRNPALTHRIILLYTYI